MDGNTLIELNYSGGTQCVLLTSGSLDVGQSPFVVHDDYKVAFELPDGTTVYVPGYFERVDEPVRRNAGAVENVQHWLGHPGYVIALLDPADLQRHSSPTVEFLSEAAIYGARLFLSTPRVLRIPRPLRWISTLMFQSQNVAEDDAGIRGLLTLTGANCIPNYHFKDLVQDFGHGATIATGYARHADPQRAVSLAAQQVDHDESANHLLVLHTPSDIRPRELREVADPAWNGPCVHAVDRTLGLTEASYYQQLV